MEERRGGDWRIGGDGRQGKTKGGGAEGWEKNEEEEETREMLCGD